MKTLYCESGPDLAAAIRVSQSGFGEASCLDSAIVLALPDQIRLIGEKFCSYVNDGGRVRPSQSTDLEMSSILQKFAETDRWHGPGFVLEASQSCKVILDLTLSLFGRSESRVVTMCEIATYCGTGYALAISMVQRPPQVSDLQFDIEKLDGKARTLLTAIMELVP